MNRLTRSIILSIIFLILPGVFAQAESGDIWFSDIKTPFSFTEKDTRALAQLVTSAFLSEKAIPTEMPLLLKQDTLPRMVFLSISNGTAPASVVMSSGNGIAQAIEQAISQARALYKPGTKPIWIKLDIVEDVYPMTDFNLARSVGLESSLYGMAFDKQSGLAFLPEELEALSIIGNDKKIKLETC